MRWAAQVDSNQQEIMDALRSFGWKVRSLHRVGGDFPDIIAAKLGAQPKRTILIEIKVEGGKLSPAQKEFQDTWPGEVFVVWSVDDLISQLGGVKLWN